MATLTRFPGPSQIDLENLVTIGNGITERQELYDRVAGSILDQVIRVDSDFLYESGHRAQVEVERGTDGTRQEHLLLDGRRVHTRVIGPKSKLKKRRRFP